jgi:hypothetical protein
MMVFILLPLLCVAAWSVCSWRPGGASLLWVECALQSLSTDLVSRYGPGASIVYKHGPYAQALTEVRGHLALRQQQQVWREAILESWGLSQHAFSHGDLVNRPLVVGT